MPVDARDRLRQYLLQRKEMGEQDLVLDGLSVEDLLKVIGAPGGCAANLEAALGPRPTKQSKPSPRPEIIAPPSGAIPVAKIAAAAKPAAKDAPFAPPAAAASAAAANVVFDFPPISVGGVLVDGVAPYAGGLTTLDAIAAAVGVCTRCPLHSTATNAVPGEGNPDAKFVCVGEAPGATEDATGRPFIGRAGDLLTKILEAIKLKREDVFICNVLKHRPPGNRNPAAEEIAACSPYLLQQLAILRPRVILALGTFAAQTLLQTTQPIGKLRGQIHRFYGVPLIVTYHPAALLRNPNWKRPAWEDVQLARRIFDNAPGA